MTKNSRERYGTDEQRKRWKGSKERNTGKQQRQSWRVEQQRMSKKIIVKKGEERRKKWRRIANTEMGEKVEKEIDKNSRERKGG